MKILLMCWSRALVVGTLVLTDRIPSVGSFASAAYPLGGLSLSRNGGSLGSCSSSSSSSLSSNNDNNNAVENDSSKGSCSNNASPDFKVAATTITTRTTALATSPFALDKYHLIWSPGAWKKIVGTTAVMILLPKMNQLPLLRRVFHQQAASPLFAGTTTSGLYSNLVLPLAASSCCLLQLGLNVLSVGCAGWNSYLGPVRPYFMGILMVSSWRHPPASLTTLLWRSVVTFLPELVHLYNQWATGRQERNQQDTIRAATANGDLDQYIMQVDIPTMGCVACIQNINSSLRKIPGVIRATSELKPLGQKGGHATVVVATDDTATMTNQIVDAAANAGFDGAYLTAMQPRKDDD